MKEALNIKPRQLTRVGSRETCVPAPTDTDQDWLALVHLMDFQPLADHLLATGWQVGGSLIDPQQSTLPDAEVFSSFKREDQNLLVTVSEEFHKRFLAASSFAARMNLLHKPDRIALFQAVLYANIGNPRFSHMPDVDLDIPY